MDTSKGGGLRIFITGPDGQVKAQASGGDRHLLWVRRAEEENARFHVVVEEME